MRNSCVLFFSFAISVTAKSLKSVFSFNSFYILKFDYTYTDLLSSFFFSTNKFRLLRWMNWIVCFDAFFVSNFFLSFFVSTRTIHTAIHYTMIAQSLWYYLFESQIKQAHNMILCMQNHRLVRPFVWLSELHRPIGPETWSQTCKISAIRLPDSPNRSDQFRTFPKIWIIIVRCQSDIHFCGRYNNNNKQIITEITRMILWIFETRFDSIRFDSSV